MKRHERECDEERVGQHQLERRHVLRVVEQPVPESGIPKPGSLSVQLKDDHLQYAITWFMMAFAVVIAFGVWWRGQRRA